jgi:hypothetical protein
MTYPAQHYKVTVYGDAYSGAEEWSFGWRTQKPVTADVDAAAQAHASAIQSAVTAFWSGGTSGTQFFNTHRLQGVKVAVIDPDGQYPDGHIAGEVMFANVAGPYVLGGGERTVAQNAMCVTLTTLRPRGLASKGRFFLPPMNWQISSDGLISTAGRDAIVTRVKTFLDAVNAAAPAGEDIAVFSRGKGVKSFNAETGKIEWDYPNTGYFATVTGVEVGRVVDTIRRRRRQLVESRAGQALA